MELLLVRHGIAEDIASSGRDTDRALTPEGIERFSQAVAGLAGVGWRVDRVLHSPWRRARQTAELMEPMVGDAAQIETLEALAEPPDAQLLSAVERTGADRVALVGHEPWMSTLLAWLVADRPELGANTAFKKGAIARLEGRLIPGAMQLLAFVPPSVARRLDGARV